MKQFASIFQTSASTAGWNRHSRGTHIVFTQCDTSTATIYLAIAWRKL
jgi:hypothetical protein